MLKLPLIVLAFFAASAAGATPAPVLTFKGTQPGERTLDEGEGGGNPFASAVIRALADESLTLAALPGHIGRNTGALSGGFQRADVPAVPEQPAWRIGRPAPGERRVALVLIISAYKPLISGLASLPGAEHDAGRVAAALRAAGYDTRVELDPFSADVPAVLADFAARSASADAAVIYSTGHGVEVDGTGYLLSAGYPMWEGAFALPERATQLSDIAAAAKAKQVNLFFFAGCRDNPFGS